MRGREPLAYLELIEYAVRRAMVLQERMTLDEFLSDETARDTAFVCNHDIGDGIRQLIQAYPSYAARITNYRRIIGSRDAVSHRLFSRDFERLWTNFAEGLPLLRDEIAELIAELRA